MKTERVGWIRIDVPIDAIMAMTHSIQHGIESFTVDRRGAQESYNVIDPSRKCTASLGSTPILPHLPGLREPRIVVFDFLDPPPLDG
jgi:hypothetical protein